MKERLKILRAKMKAKKLEAVIFFAPEDILAVAGFRASQAILLVSQRHIWLFLDDRYFHKPVGAGIEKEKVENFTKEFFVQQKIKRLGTPLELLSVKRYRKLNKMFKISDFSLAEILAKKDSREIQSIKKASQIADMALTIALKNLTIGLSEKELAFAIEKAGRELGAEKISFDFIVAFGANSAIPHHEASDKKLEKNMPILIDFGFQVSGYASDCTRSFFFGQPSKKWLETYKKVLKAQEAGINKIAATKPVKNVFLVAEKVLGEKLLHAFGHGLGTRIHESPSISNKSKEKFINSSCFTAEPGLYYPGQFGIRIEDTLLLQSNKIEFLTKFTKKIEEMII